MCCCVVSGVGGIVMDGGGRGVDDRRWLCWTVV